MTKEKMNRQEAIEYLDRKGELESEKYQKIADEGEKSEKELIADDEEKIKEVMKKGKIFGDPVIECF